MYETTSISTDIGNTVMKALVPQEHIHSSVKIKVAGKCDQFKLTRYDNNVVWCDDIFSILYV